MDKLHSLLQRQLRRFGAADVPPELLAAVDQAYRQFDDDRNMLERSMELSSRELLEANAALRGMTDDLERMVAERTAELERATLRAESELDERRRLEQDLLQAQKMEAVGRLAGGIAHDFNNLLTAILGNGDFLFQALRDDPTLSAYVIEVQEAGQRAAALTQQLLAFSRKQHLNPTVLDLNFLVTDLTRMLRRMIGEDVELVSVAAPGLLNVRADAGQIEQAVMNLVVNARDAMPDGGKIVIATRNVEVTSDSGSERNDLPPGSYVALSVTDTGEGIAPDVETHLFEPFFTTKAKGTGLGLATVYGMVKQSGGSVSVTSAPGEGAAFTLFFPAVAASAEQLAQAARWHPKGGSEVVLLVEDEDAVRSLAREILQSGGYTVLEARYGDEALTVAERYDQPIDLLVADVVMPGMSGTELSTHLTPRRPEMRVLYISGYSDGLLSRMNGPGRDEPVAFLPKPFLPEDMLRAVRRALDGREAA